MAVYEHSYKPYDGTLTPAWSRFLVLPRYAYETVFKSKFAIGFLVACMVAPLLYTILIYLNHNVSALEILGLPAGAAIPITPEFFGILIGIQTGLGFLFTVVNGPDRNNDAVANFVDRPDIGNPRTTEAIRSPTTSPTSPPSSATTETIRQVPVADAAYLPIGSTAAGIAGIMCGSPEKGGKRSGNQVDFCLHDPAQPTG